MDSTPTPSPPPPPFIPHLTTTTTTTSKLPIKRKTPTYSPINLPPPSTTTPPPKFHRVWTESDEIRFLRGLVLHSPSPKDLPLFFSQFSSSNPYSKSQLSDKLRRLRKKYGLLSSRLANNKSLLSPHDQLLFDLSHKLWRPRQQHHSIDLNNDLNEDQDKDEEEEEVLSIGKSNNSNDNKEEEEEEEEEEDYSNCEIGIGEIAAKTAVDVFDQCLKETKMAGGRRMGGRRSFEERWRELRVVEMEALGKRLRLLVNVQPPSSLF